MLCLLVFACFSVLHGASRQGEWDISSVQMSSLGSGTAVEKNRAARPLKPVAQDNQIKFPGGIRINAEPPQDMLLTEDRFPGLASPRFGVRIVTAASHAGHIYASHSSRAPPAM